MPLINTDIIEPPEHIMDWIKHHWSVSRVTHKDISQQETRKIGRTEVVHMVYKNVWNVQIEEGGCNICPIQKERKGIRVEHENHIYVDITECCRYTIVLEMSIGPSSYAWWTVHQI